MVFRAEALVTTWVDKLSASSFTPLPCSPPKYWHHPLVMYLDLPDLWPIDWTQECVRDKAFTLFLEFFNPPGNLQGLGHQLIALEFIIKSASEIASVTTECQIQLDAFLEQLHDFMSQAAREEKSLLLANKLDDITNLGLWRLHFHCSQVVRTKIDLALNLSPESGDSEHGNIISVARLEYLRDGDLDQIYQSIAPELHRYLKRRRLLKIELHGQSDNDRLNPVPDVIYGEVLASEHCIHLAHLIIRDKSAHTKHRLSNAIKSSLRKLSDRENVKIELAKYDPEIAHLIKKIIANIRTVHRLLSTFGGTHKRKADKLRTFTSTPAAKDGRLLPPGRYEDTDDSREDSIPATIEEPLNIIHGTTEDDSLDALFSRKYGRRPKISHNLGESEEDYREGNTISIPASWLVDPYRNAIKQRIQEEGLILTTEPPAWSSACLMVHTIKQYTTNALKCNSDLCLLALTALHTGIHEHRLKTFSIGNPPIFDLMEAPDKISEDLYLELADEIEIKWTNNIFFDPETFSYAYALTKKESAYYDVSQASFISDCEAATRIIRIPLPPVLHTPMLACLKAQEEKHGSITCQNSKEPKTYLKLFRNWKKTTDRWADLMVETGLVCDENISPGKIRSTFRSLYVGQMNLSNLHANLVSAEVPLHYRAQHFYANFPYIKLHEQYIEASKSIVNALTDNSVNEVGHQFDRDEARAELRFGSRLVPKQECLASYFSELFDSFKDDIHHRRMSANAWNRMTLFVLRLLQLTTGIRPARDALPDWGHISFKLGWLRISDKDNLHYYESRIIPMASTLRAWLTHIGSLQLSYFIGMNFRPSRLPNGFRDKPTKAIFVYMDIERKIIRPLTFDHIRSIEDEAMLSQRFDFKANALRHNLLSRLHESGLEQPIIDFIMGHKHFGREPFGRFSPISSTKYAERAVNFVDQYITKPLGIEGPNDNDSH